MIDFQNASFVKLRAIPPNEIEPSLAEIFIEGEVLLSGFRGMRDGVVFTNKRIIVINVQGVTGKKKDFTSLPYSKIQAFSIETAGTFDLDSELELYFSGLGKVRLEFTSRTNITQICRVISGFVMR